MCTQGGSAFGNLVHTMTVISVPATHTTSEKGLVH